MLLPDSVDTRSALDAMRELVSSSNIYIDTCRKSGTPPNGLLLKNIAAYITRILKVCSFSLFFVFAIFLKPLLQNGYNVNIKIMN